MLRAYVNIDSVVEGFGLLTAVPDPKAVMDFHVCCACVKGESFAGRYDDPKLVAVEGWGSFYQLDDDIDPDPTAAHENFTRAVEKCVACRKSWPAAKAAILH